MLSSNSFPDKFLSFFNLESSISQLSSTAFVIQNAMLYEPFRLSYYM